MRPLGNGSRDTRFPTKCLSWPTLLAVPLPDKPCSTKSKIPGGNTGLKTLGRRSWTTWPGCTTPHLGLTALLLPICLPGEESNSGPKLGTPSKRLLALMDGVAMKSCTSPRASFSFSPTSTNLKAVPSLGLRLYCNGGRFAFQSLLVPGCDP